ncbi:MAG TPA: glycosyltransferase [Bryobacteraceae bacterium]|nr:glycosyltransferase [Bryobacteraceae bacterium]
MHRTCTIVIPCYNEEKRFPLQTFAEFAAAHPEIGFLLVNDGSRDNTLSVLERARAGREDQVSVLNQPVNGGKAEAVRAGMLHALTAGGCRVAGFWDADFATPLDAISQLFSILENRPEIAMVFGARVKLLGRQVERRAVRHYLGRIFATTVSTMLRLPIYDTQCGAKLFRANEEARELFRDPFHSRWVFDVEILARFIRLRGYRMPDVEKAIYEYPLEEWRDVAGSQVKPTDFFRAFFDVVRIRQRYRR